MLEQIGFLSSDIIEILKEHNELSVLAIRTRLGVSNTSVYLAIGWLLREGKVNLRKGEKDFTVGLIK